MKTYTGMKVSLPIGVIFLFIVLAVIPLVIGHCSETIDQGLISNDAVFNNFDIHRYPESYSSNMSIFSLDNEVESDDLCALEYAIQMPFDKDRTGDAPEMSGGPIDSAWPVYCHDTHHTGRSPYSTINDTNEKWRYKMSDGWQVGSPVIDSDGILYTGSDKFYTIYPNGTLKWKYSEWRGDIASTTPTIDENGVVYIGIAFNEFDSKNFYAFYPNGTVKWIFKMGNDVFSSPAIGEDGTIYCAAGKYFYAIYPNGTLRWKYKTGDYIWGSSPAISEDSLVYCGSHDDYVYAWYPNNGTVKWKFDTGSWVHGSPTIGPDGTIYIGSDSGNLYALYPNNGTMKWKCKVGSIWGSPALGEDGTLYVGVWNEKFRAVNPNGTIKWTYDAPGRIWFGASPIISADGTIYFGTTPAMEGDSGAFIALNPDGSEKWRDDFGYYESSPAIGSDGTLYVVSSHGSNRYSYLRAFGSGESNMPPDKPTITGETDGDVGEEYAYTFVAVDPDGDSVSYYIRWGDDTNSSWLGPYGSGEEITVKHTWSEEGTYTVKAKARDRHGAESDWGTLEVSMPKSKTAINSFLFQLIEKLLDRFPNAFPVLRYLLGL